MQIRKRILSGFSAFAMLMGNVVPAAADEYVEGRLRYDSFPNVYTYTFTTSGDVSFFGGEAKSTFVSASQASGGKKKFVLETAEHGDLESYCLDPSRAAIAFDSTDKMHTVTDGKELIRLEFSSYEAYNYINELAYFGHGYSNYDFSTPVDHTDDKWYFATQYAIWKYEIEQKGKTVTSFDFRIDGVTWDIEGYANELIRVVNDYRNMKSHEANATFSYANGDASDGKHFRLGAIIRVDMTDLWAWNTDNSLITNAHLVDDRGNRIESLSPQQRDTGYFYVMADSLAEVDIRFRSAYEIRSGASIAPFLIWEYGDSQKIASIGQIHDPIPYHKGFICENENPQIRKEVNGRQISATVSFYDASWNKKLEVTTSKDADVDLDMTELAWGEKYYIVETWVEDGYQAVSMSNPAWDGETWTKPASVAGTVVDKTYLQPDSRYWDGNTLVLNVPNNQTEDHYEWSVLKVDDKGKLLAGARLQLLSQDESQVFAEWTSATQAYDLTGIVDPGTYKVKELEAPEGYEIDTGVKTVTFERGKTTEVTFRNNPKTEEYHWWVEKLAEGRQIPGAEIHLYDSTGKDVFHFTSGSEKEDLKDRVSPGTYTVKELKAPAGYVLTKEEKTVTLTEGKTASVSLDNYRIGFLKVDKTGSPLAEVKLQVLASDQTTVVIPTWTSGSDPYYPEVSLEEGKTYYLHEVETPEGYKEAEDVEFKPETVEVKDGIRIVRMVNYPEGEYHWWVRKQDRGTLVAGAEIHIYDSQGTDVYHFTSGSEPEDLKGKVEPGEYTARETGAPAGYVLSAKETRLKLEYEKTRTVYIDNYRVGFLKTDESGSPLAGAKLTVLAEDKTTVVVPEWTSRSEPYYPSVSLEEGKTYYLHEVTAPEGYEPAEDVEFKPETAESTDDGRIVRMSDKKKTEYHWYISKVNSIGQRVAGCTLAIYRNHACTDEVYRFVSKADSDEDVTNVGLETGVDYYVKELAVPEGSDYELSTTVKKVTFKKNVTSTVKFYNRNKLAEHSAAKVNADGEYIAGALLLFIPKDNIENPDYPMYPDNEFEITSANSPVTLPADKLATGIPYYVYELAAPAGYISPDPEKLQAEVTFLSTEPVLLTLTNYRIYARKQDLQDGKPLAGAEFEVREGSVSGKKVDSWTTDTVSELHAIKGLSDGKTYWIVETKAPVGYKKADPVQFTVNLDDMTEDLIIRIEDEKVKPLFISKKDADNQAVAGAELAVYDGDTQVMSWTTTGTSKNVANELTAGRTYTLREIKAPAGYVKAADVSFTYRGEEEETVTMYDFRISALKVDKKTGQAVAGARMQVRTDKDDASFVIYEWTTGSEAVYLENLEEGHSYWIVETEAPNGYKLAAPQEFTATAGSDTVITVEDEKIEARVYIRKNDAEGNTLSGAHLAVYDGDNMILDWITDGNEKEIEGSLFEHGKTYIVRELEAPAGYVQAADQAFIYDAENEEANRVIVNDFQVMVIKADEEGSPLEGASLEVREGSVDGTAVDAWTTDGQYHTVNNLAEGKTYFVVETAAPYGYKVAEPEEFTAVFNGENITITVSDEKLDLPVFIRKTYNSEPLSGAILQILDSAGSVVFEWETDGETKEITGILNDGEDYVLHEQSAPAGFVRASDISFTFVGAEEQYLEMKDFRVLSRKLDRYGNRVAGTQLEVRDAQGNTVDAWTTSADEDHYISGLVQDGTYTLVETKAPKGYDLAQPVEFTASGEADFEVVMMDEEISLQIRKVDTDGNPVAGAKLAIYEGDTFIEEFVTGEEPYSTRNIEIGHTYIVKETETPAGYVKAADVSVTIGSGITEVTMTDTRVLAVKVDEDDVPVAGAKLEVRDENGRVIDSWVTNGTEYAMNGLEYGKTYRLVEGEAPVGYHVAEPVAFTAGDENITVKMVDKLKHVYVSITKRDADTAVLLAGAEFTIYRHADDEPVMTITTDNRGKASADLIYDANNQDGWYMMETKAPEGYLNDNEGKRFEIVPGETYTFEASDKTFAFAAKDTINTVLNLIKTDTETVTPQGEAQLAGAEYTLYDPDGVAVHTFVFDENGHTEALHSLRKDLVYTLKETKAPEGYRLDEQVCEISFADVELDEDGAYEITRVLEEEVIKGAVRIHKVRSLEDHEESEPEEGAEFTIIAKKHVDFYGSFEAAMEHMSEFGVNEYDVLVTDENGDAASKALAYGTYIIRQTKATAETQICEDEFEFAVDEADQELVVFNVTNISNPYRLRIVKLDSESLHKIVYTSADYRIRRVEDEDGNPVDEPVVQTVDGVEYSIFRTTSEKTGEIPAGTFVVADGAKGIAVTPLTVSAGKYEITEVSAPEGFTLGRDVYVVTVMSSHVETIDENGIPTITVKVTNNRIYGKLNIRKTVEDYDADTDLIEDLSGIEFTVIARKDIINPVSGEVVVKAGDVYGKYVTDSDGTVTVSRMPLGEYTLFESETPAGIILKAAPYEFTLAQADDRTLEYTAEYSLENEVTKVEISKTDVTGEAELPGAVLVLEDAETGETIDRWVSADDPHRIAGLSRGKTYILTESITPRDDENNDLGYVRASSIEFTIQEDGTVQKVVMVDKVVTMSKVDIAGQEMPGAKMKVLDEEGNVMDEWISDGTPHRIHNLEAGKTYTLIEDLAPLGYVKASAVTFTVADDGKNQHVEMTDKIVTVSKKDLGGEELAGAAMSVTNEEGNIIDCWMSDGTEHAVSGLEIGGHYVLHEDTAPLGYVKALDIEFTAEESMEDQKIVMVDKVVTVSKKDLGGQEIAGAEMSVAEILEDEEGNTSERIVDTWISDGSEHRVAGLEEGHSYILKEVTAPGGYVKATDIPFEVSSADENGVKVDQHIDVTDKKITVSKVDLGGEELAGAAMSVTDEEGNIIDCWMSDGTEHAVNGLEIGKTYVLHEDTAPLGYVKALDIEFTTEESMEDQKIIMVDKVVLVSKTDVTGEAELPGAVLAVYDAEGRLVDSWISGDQPHAVSGLSVGCTYRLVEEFTPVDEEGNDLGYVKAGMVEFTVNEEMVIETVRMIDKVVTVSKVDIAGEEIRGAEMIVADEDGQTVDSWTSDGTPHRIRNLEAGRTYTLIEDLAPVGYVKASAVSFTVTDDGADQHIDLVDKMVIVSKADMGGEEIEGAEMSVFEITEDVEGKMTELIVDAWRSEAGESHAVNGLEEGHSYILRELAAPDGYVLATEIAFEVTGEDEEGIKYDQLVVMTDKIVMVSKTDLGGQEVEGAVIQILDSDGNIVDEWVSGKQPHKVIGLKAGEEYIMHEEAAPDGYYYAEDAVFTVTDDGIDQGETMVDMPIVYEILKIDDQTGKLVEGVELRLFDITANEEVDGSPWITTGEPIILDRVLIAGHEYELVESEWVAGVHKSTSITFSVGLTGTADKTTITMVDLVNAISFLKVNPEGKPLAGAVLQILAAVKTEDGKVIPAVDDNGKEMVITSFTTSDDPKGVSVDDKGVEIASLLKGDSPEDPAEDPVYILREVSAPFGYALAEDIVFTVKGTVEQPQMIRMTDERKTVYVSVDKVDANDHSKKLAGAEITIYNAATNQIARTVDGKAAVSVTNLYGRAVFELPYLEDGYYARETKAPAEYRLNRNNFRIVLSDDYDFAKDHPIVITVDDRKKPADTGVLGPVGAACLMLISAAVIYFMVKKKKKDLEE